MSTHNRNIDANVRKAIKGFNRNRLEARAPVPPPVKQPARKVKDVLSQLSDAQLDEAIRARKK